MKKRICCALLLLLVCALPLAGALAGLPFEARLASPGPEDMKEKEALAYARPVWQAAIGTADDPENFIRCVPTFIEFAQGGTPRPAWAMTLHDSNGKHPSCLAVIDARTGDTLYVESFTTYEQQLAADARNDPMWFWPLAEKEIYFHLYMKSVEGEYDLMVAQPGDDDLPEEEARAIAEAAIERYCGVSAARLAPLRLDTSFDRSVSMPNVRYWIFSYRPMIEDAHGGYANLYQVTLSAVDGELVLVADPHTIRYPESAGGGQG